MMQGKSSLNAHAAPYVPISRNSSGGENKPTKNTVDVSVKTEDTKNIMSVPEKNENVGEAADYQLPENVILDQHLEFVHISNKSSSDMVHSSSEKQSMMGDTNLMIDFLMTTFPGYSAESLAEFLDFNNGNLDDTVDWLEEFESESEIPRTSRVPQCDFKGTTSSS